MNFHFSGADGSSSSQSDRFSINLLTGEISVDPRTLDYEQATSHTLCVNASTSNSDASLNSDQWKVVVRVTDRDDNVLQFLQATQSVGMCGQPHFPLFCELPLLHCITKPMHCKN